MSAKLQRQQQKAGLGAGAVSAVTLAVAVAAFVAGAAGGFIFAGKDGAGELVEFLALRLATAADIATIGTIGLGIIVILRFRFVQHYILPAYDDYIQIIERAANSRNTITAIQAELAKAYSFSSTVTLVGIQVFIGLIVAAQIIVTAWR